ncbi:putative serine protease K12H4.7 isoform X2 [Bemisia tabaci]|uniref:putative serine protease K12H4.7 isoform X2 n=1 Tax=Bemisia tabaci TaxID=7038 RepID=UPI003B28AD16
MLILLKMTLPIHLTAYTLLLISAASASTWRPGFASEEMLRQLDFHDSVPNVEDGLEWFEQKLDHFNPACTETWLQRYAVRMDNYGDNNLVFLFVEGYGAVRTKWLKHGHMSRMAEKFSAAEFIVEHRFYGGSKPKPNISLESLKFLSSEQSLADLAHFIKGMNTLHDFKNPKWIVFGGAYGGSLAAWLRYKYPHLVFAAVTSGSPLQAKVDFSEYMQKVSDSLALVNPQCVDAIKAANQKLIDGMSNATKREHYRELFRLCEPLEWNEKDIMTFFNSLRIDYTHAVQSHHIGMNTDSDAAYIDMNTMCNVMTDESIHCPVHRYAEVHKLLLASYGEKCTDHKYDGMVEWLKDTSYGPETNFWRQLYYQHCTEFGWFQSSGEKNDTFGDQFPAQFFIDLCTDVYGPSFDSEHLNKSAEETNTNYGGLSLPVSRVVFIHGSIDPWSPLGITTNPPEGSYAILINGVAHCASMLPETRDDPPQLIEARKKTEQIVGDWITGKKHRLAKRTFVF